MKKVLVVMLVAFVALTTVFANGKQEVNTNKLKIGMFSSITDSSGRLQKETIELFVDKWNREKTFGDIEVEFVAYDNTNNGIQDTEMSIKATQKLLYEDKVQILIPGQMSNIIQATGEFINSEKVIGIGLGLSATWMQQGWDYLYRAALNNDYQVPSLTKAMTDLGQKNVAILYANTDNCLTFRNNFIKACDDAKIKVTGEQKVADGESNLTGPIANLLKTNPDCIFVTFMGGNFGAAIKQIRQLGYEGTIYIGQNLHATEVESVGAEDLNGVIFCSPYVTYTKLEDCTNAYIGNALKLFSDKYNYVPVDDQFYKAWDACLIIEEALKVAKSTNTDEINKAIKTLKIEGCAGLMDFTTGSNECYFAARPWVYTGQGSAGAPVVMEDWLKTDLVKQIKLTAN